MLELIIFVVGFISGMYVITQIERSVDKNINTKNLKRNIENYESFVNKHYKKRTK